MTKEKTHAWVDARRLDSTPGMDEKLLHLSYLAETCPDMVWTVNADYALVLANQAFVDIAPRIFGAQPEPGKNILALLPEAEQSVWKKRLDKALRGYSFTVEQDIPANDQTEAWMLSFHPVFGHKKNIVGAACRGARSTVNQRMVQEMTRINAAIEQAGEAFILLARDWTMQYVNPAFEAMTGFHLREVAGKSARGLIRKAALSSAFETMFEAGAQGKSWQGRIPCLRKNGGCFTANITISPVRNEQGETINYFAIMQDVTRLEELQARVRELRRLEALGTFAGGVAHGFNNILQSMIGLADLAADEVEKGSPVHALLERITQSGAKAARLVQQILTFSRQTEPEIRPLSLSPLVGAIMEQQEAWIPENIQVVTHIRPACGEVMADMAALHQMMHQLCANACQAMEDTGGLLEVTLDQAAPGSLPPEITIAPNAQGYVRLTVRDTGRGMDRRTLERIFDPFFTTKEVGKGTGMGLATVHGIVESCKGVVFAESAPGKGSVFTVYLPLIDALETQAGNRTQPGPGLDERPFMKEYGEVAHETHSDC